MLRTNYQYPFHYFVIRLYKLCNLRNSNILEVSDCACNAEVCGSFWLFVWLFIAHMVQNSSLELWGVVICKQLSFWVFFVYSIDVQLIQLIYLLNVIKQYCFTIYQNSHFIKHTEARSYFDTLQFAELIEIFSKESNDEQNWQ